MLHKAAKNDFTSPKPAISQWENTQVHHHHSTDTPLPPIVGRPASPSWCLWRIDNAQPYSPRCETLRNITELRVVVVSGDTKASTLTARAPIAWL